MVIIAPIDVNQLFYNPQKSQQSMSYYNLIKVKFKYEING